MKRILFTLLLILAPLAGETLLARGYQNPVVAGYHPDPSICRVGDDYYMVTSTFEYFPGVPIFHSKDLVNWEKIGHCLTRPSQLDLEGCRASGGIFAPTLRYHDGRFYMVTTNITGKGNFLVHTTDPSGEWSEPVWLEQKGIDPSLYWEGDTCYLASNPNDEIMLSTINPLTGEQLTPPRHIWSGTGGRFPEAPHIYKKDGWYYLVLSEGGTQYGHKVTIGRSRNIYGPYSGNPANPILTHTENVTKRNPIQGTGHADFVEAADGSWWLVCLGFRPLVYRHHMMGRETFLAPVTWPTNGWPVVNGNGTIDLQMDVETLPLHPFPAKASRDNFDAPTFDVEWNFLRNPIEANYKLANGVLKMQATEVELTELASPSFVGQRQSSAYGTTTVSMEIPRATQEITAGMTLFMNNLHHYKLAVEKRDGKSTLVLSYKIGNMEHTAKEVAVLGRRIYLRVESTPAYYKFYYSTNNRDYTHLADMDTRYLSSETAGGFTGLYYALYATSSKKNQWVEFDWFDYVKRNEEVGKLAM